MGYRVEIELENVELPLSKKDEAIKILKELNKSWQKSNDWCQFDSGFTDLADIVNNIGFSCGENDTNFYIDEFEREKLGGHCEMFNSLAPVLDDCCIRFYEEDHIDWKIIIEDHKAETIYREEL